MDCLYTFTQNPITFYSCGNLVSPGGFLHQRRTLHCHVLIYVLEGTLSITANGHAREVAPGEYIFLRSEEEHFGHAASSGKLSYLWMHFDTHTPWSRISSEEGIRIYDSCTYLFPEYGRGSTDFPLLSGDLMQWYRKGTAVAEKALPQTASLLLFHLTSAFLDRRESRPLTLTGMSNCFPLIFASVFFSSIQSSGSPCSHAGIRSASSSCFPSSTVTAKLTAQREVWL